MRKLLPYLALAFGLGLASPAAADCFADYKAKKDNPLRLHYGVVKLPDDACANRRDAVDAVASRIGDDGWTLLNVLSVFGESGLQERKESAGRYYLRY